MCFAAMIFRPLRSKRAMISPDRPRANASGLTRISVFSMASSVSASSATRCLAGSGGLRLGLGELGGLRRLRGDRRLVGRLATTATRGRRGGRARLGLAERADAPRGVDRLRARVAALLELAHAARAAQVVRLDLVVAVRAERVVQAREARLG